MEKKRILIVDDEIIIADDLSNTLTKLGYEVLEPALNYNEAIRAFDEQPVDLVILDINLGTKKTGIDVANYIKNHSNTPFIYLTSFSDTRTLELAKTTMPYAYLVKPYEAVDVMTAIEIALNNHERFLSNSGEDETKNIPEFTSMEKVVLRKIAENLTTKKIAKELFVSESTVKNHRHNICKKLELPATTHSLLSWVLSHKKYLNN
jgi:DNA-binding NarL/FixJ family response regulator